MSIENTGLLHANWLRYTDYGTSLRGLSYVNTISNESVYCIFMQVQNQENMEI